MRQIPAEHGGPIGFISDIISIGKEVVDVGGDLFGGDGGSQSWQDYYMQHQGQGLSCPNTPSFNSIEAAVLSCPWATLETLGNALRAANDGLGPRSRAEFANRSTMALWVNAVMGGKDCVNKSQPWMIDHLRQMVRQYGGSAGVPEDTGEVGTTPGTSDPDYVGDTGGYTPPGSIEDAIAGIGQNIEDYLAGILGGAVEGAQEGSQPAPQNQPATLTAGFDGNTLVLLAIAAAAVAAVVALR